MNQLSLDQAIDCGGRLRPVVNAHSLSIESRESWALNLIEDEEVVMAKSLERLDIVTRIGPTLGLMGTLIPMGPGLAALGSGDVSTLANAIIVAFDTTVMAFFIHTALLHQAFAHCAIFPIAVSRRSLDRVSVPMWPVTLSSRLPIVALVGCYLTN